MALKHRKRRTSRKRKKSRSKYIKLVLRGDNGLLAYLKSGRRTSLLGIAYLDTIDNESLGDWLRIAVKHLRK